jgi:hypothetical protein
MENARCCHGKERFLKFDLNTLRRVLNEQNWLPIKKNKNQFYKFNTINATNVQNGHRFSLGKLQINSNMHPLRFVTFPV